MTDTRITNSATSAVRDMHDGCPLNAGSKFETALRGSELTDHPDRRGDARLVRDRRSRAIGILDELDSQPSPVRRMARKYSWDWVKGRAQGRVYRLSAFGDRWTAEVASDITCAEPLDVDTILMVERSFDDENEAIQWCEHWVEQFSRLEARDDN